MYEDIVKTIRYCLSADTTCATCDYEDDPACVEKLLQKAADAIVRLNVFNINWQEAAKMAHEKETKWIPVTERLPEPNAVDEYGFVKGYLVKTDRHVMMHTARYTGEWWILWGETKVIAGTVTHWMPLPEPPKEET